MKILFQGDSITDVGRNTNNGSLISIGQGYPCLISARIGADIATIPYKVIAQLAKHPLTDIGIQKFLADWEKRKQ